MLLNQHLASMTKTVSYVVYDAIFSPCSWLNPLKGNKEEIKEEAAKAGSNDKSMVDNHFCQYRIDLLLTTSAYHVTFICLEVWSPCSRHIVYWYIERGSSILLLYEFG